MAAGSMGSPWTAGCAGCEDSHRYHHNKACKERREKWMSGETLDPRSASSATAAATPVPEQEVGVEFEEPNQDMEEELEEQSAEKSEKSEKRVRVSVKEPKKRTAEFSATSASAKLQTTTGSTYASSSGLGQATEARGEKRKEEGDTLEEVITELSDMIAELADDELHGPVKILRSERLMGRMKELDFMSLMNAVKLVLITADAKMNPMMWVENWAGTECRSRLVVMDIGKGKPRDECFAATPSATGLRIILCIASAYGLTVMKGDFSRAFLHADAEPGIYLRPPKQAMVDPGMCWEAIKAVYGLREAPKWFQDWFAKVLTEKMEFGQCLVDSQIFVHKERKCYLHIHVDDPWGAGPKAQIEEVFEEMGHYVNMKFCVQLTPGMSVTHLARTYLKTLNGFKITLGEKYSKDVVELAGMMKCKSSDTPGVTSPGKEEKEANEIPTDEDEKRLYMQVVGRVQYMSEDRPDLQYASKELPREMTSPTQGSIMSIKKLVRYIHGHKRAVQTIELDEMPRDIMMHVD